MMMLAAAAHLSVNNCGITGRPLYTELACCAVYWPSGVGVLDSLLFSVEDNCDVNHLRIH